MESISSKPIHKRYDRYTNDEERHEANKARMLKCYYKKRENILAERRLNGFSPKKGGRPRKYKTDQERSNAIKNHTENHKDFIWRGRRQFKMSILDFYSNIEIILKSSI